MSSHGGRRVGSGRKKLHESPDAGTRFWQKGHRRLWFDNIVYSSWISARIRCGYASDSLFAVHLLSLERRRIDEQEDKSKTSRKRKQEEEIDPSKRQRHLGHGGPLTTSTPTRGVIHPMEIIPTAMGGDDISRYSEAEVDVTGVTEMSVSNTSYIIEDGSVVIEDDGNKYGSLDESISDGHASDSEGDETGIFVRGAVESALKDLDEDLQGDLSSNESESSEMNDLGLVIHDMSDSDDELTDAEDNESSVLATVSPVRPIMQPVPIPLPLRISTQPVPLQSSMQSATLRFSMQSAPLPPSMPSAPLPPSTQSAPLPPSTQSAPLPPSTQSAPIPPSMLSAPLPPSTQSTPLPPSMLSAPLPPSTQSVPLHVPPSMLSAPLPPSMQSAPLPPSTQSTPLPPSTQSTPLLPSTPSAPLPPSAQTAPLPSFPLLSRLEEQGNYKKELDKINETKIICSLNLLLELFKECRELGCTNNATLKYHLVGPTVVVNWMCPSGHKGKFSSSHEVNELKSNNLQAAASIILSGNNFAKVERMAKFLGLNFISDSTFYRMQRLYFIPAINEWWSWQREQIIQQFINQEIVVCGDGQCDSPGHTAKNLCYFLMELVSGYIVEVEVRDKRHVGLSSSNMERQALQKALQRLRSTLNVVEVVTDASPAIKKMLADNFALVFHSLDVWHKAKSIRKCLAKVGQLKNMEKVKAWTEHIILHFWHCSSICKGTATTSDEEALVIMKNNWIGLLHHVCNQHEWTGGKCSHGELEEHELPWFDRRDKDYEALQKVILEPKLLESFKSYVRFRHTGSLECANSLTLVYTVKRCSYSYKVYKARKQLSAIDWNFHLKLEAATSEAGEIRATRKYNQRTKDWDSKVVKVKKKFEYIPLMMAKIMRMREEDVDVVARHVSLNESDPALIAPTIAEKPAPSSKELFQRRKSRFAKSTGVS